MPWIDPGEFGRGSAAREDTRIDRERTVLDQLLAAGWTGATAAEARRLQEAMADAVARASSRPWPATCNETALGLVGEARGAAVADWWAESRGLDDRSRALLRECAAAAAAMAMVDGFHLGRETAAESKDIRPVLRPAAPATRYHNGATANGARVAALT